MTSATATIIATGNHKTQILLIALAMLIGNALSGCTSIRSLTTFKQPDPMAGAPRLRNIKNPPIGEVIAHLNQNTDRIQSWRADNVTIQTSGWSLSGKLAVEKNRRVRLFVSSPMGNEVDLGSNDERFWVWSRRLDPAFVTCKHENMEFARQELGIPFEPDWLMQALGVSRLPTTGVKMEAAPNDHQARLVEEVVSAHGRPLRRVVLVDLHRGTVLEHSLYDYNGMRVALAKLSGHRHDKNTGVVLPNRVSLELPRNRMSMTMNLGKVQINPTSIPSQIWEMPEMAGYKVVNLDAGYDQDRKTSNPDSVVRIGSLKEMSTDDETDEDETDEDNDERFRSDSFNDSAGHVRLIEEDRQPITRKLISAQKSNDESWDQ